MFFNSMKFKAHLIQIIAISGLFAQLGTENVKPFFNGVFKASGFSLGFVLAVELGQNKRLNEMIVHLPDLKGFVPKRPPTLRSASKAKKQSSEGTKPALPQGKITDITSKPQNQDDFADYQKYVDSLLNYQYPTNSITVVKKISAPRGVDKSQPFLVVVDYEYKDNQFKDLIVQNCHESYLKPDDPLFSELLERFAKPVRLFKGETIGQYLDTQRSVKKLNSDKVTQLRKA